MALNRFDTYLPNDYSFQSYTPQEFTPDLSMLDDLLGGLQQEYDTGMSTLNKVMPNYLRNSPSDVKAAKNFRAKYDDAIAKSTEAFASGSVSEGRRIMRDAMREIEKDQLPGGDYYELERRVGEYQNEVKRLREFYKDNPRLAEYAIANKIGLTDFRDPLTGESNQIAPARDIYKDISDEDISKWFNTQLDNIKDTLISQGFSKQKLDGITSLYDLKTLTGREFNDVAQILAGAFPREFVQSIRQRYAADRYFDPSLPNIDPTQVFETATDEEGNRIVATDELGRVKFANTAVGNLMRSNTLAGTRVTPKDQLIKDDDELALELTKHKLRKKEIDYEFNLGTETLRTQVYTNGSGMPELKLSPDGKGLKDERVEMRHSKIERGLTTPRATISRKENFKKYIQSEDAMREYPELVTMYNKFEDHVAGLSDEEAFKFLETKYNEKRNAMSVTDAEYTVYSPKLNKMRRDQVIGQTEGKDGARLGDIVNRTLWVHQPGREPEAMTVYNFMDKYGIENAREFIENTFVHGSIRSDNSLVPSGEEMTFNKGDKGITFVASTMSQEDMRYKSPDFTLAKPLYSSDVSTSSTTTIGIPELDQAYGPVYSQAYDVYESDLVAQQLDLGTMRADEMVKLADKYVELKANPEKDKFVERRADIYSTNTGENLTKTQGLTIEKIADLKQELRYGQRR